MRITVLIKGQEMDLFLTEHSTLLDLITQIHHVCKEKDLPIPVQYFHIQTNQHTFFTIDHLGSSLVSLGLQDGTQLCTTPLIGQHDYRHNLSLQNLAKSIWLALDEDLSRPGKETPQACQLLALFHTHQLLKAADLLDLHNYIASTYPPSLLAEGERVYLLYQMLPLFIACYAESKTAESKNNLSNLSSLVPLEKKKVRFFKANKRIKKSSLPKELSEEERQKLLGLLASPQPDSNAIQEILSHAEVLNLNQIKIGKAGIQVLAEALKTNQTLRVINLEWNKIGATEAQIIAISLEENQTLEVINLRNNDIGDAGAQALAEALKTNQTLRMINLVRNDIGDAGAKAIAEALKKNQTLREISLGVNKIGTQGAQAIAISLEENQTLCVIYLEGNNIGDDGTQAFASALKKNQTLRKINLGVNGIGAAGAQAMALALETNCTLTHIYLGCYLIGLGAISLQFIDHCLEQDRGYQQSLISQISQSIDTALAMYQVVPYEIINLIIDYYNLDEENEKDKIESTIPSAPLADEKGMPFLLTLINSKLMELIRDVFKDESRCKRIAENTWVISLSNQLSLRNKLCVHDVVMLTFSNHNMNQAAADINIEGELVLTDISEEQLKKLAVEIDNLLPKKEQYSSRSSSLPPSAGYPGIFGPSPAGPPESQTIEDEVSTIRVSPVRAVAQISSISHQKLLK